MSKLSKLFGKPQDFEIGGEIFTIHPLTLSDIDIVLDLQDPAKQASSMKKILSKTIKRSVADATDEEIEKLGVQYFKEFTDAIMKVNGLNEQH